MLFRLVGDWLLLSGVVVWAGTVVAVVRDGRARVANPAAARAAGALAALLPFAGALLWLCVRPAETLAGRRERRLAVALAEQWSPAPPATEAERPAAPAPVVQPVVRPREVAA